MIRNWLVFPLHRQTILTKMTFNRCNERKIFSC